MTTTAPPASAGHGRNAAVAVPGCVPGGIVFDTLGMPMSLSAAKSMTKNAIQSALGRTLAKLHHEPVASIDTGALIDSIEVVFLVARFYKELDRKAPDLSKIDRDDWSTLEGVADVLQTTTGGLT